METSLHRDLKSMYGGDSAQREVRVGKYRIDVVAGGELIEIQHASLAALRDKSRVLLTEHSVRIVKPIVASKQLIKRRRKNGRVVHRRRSPLRGRVLDIFDELVHFSNVFPHERLTLEVILVDVEEWRYPGHGRRRRYRANDFIVEDRKLVAIQEVVTLRTAADLAQLIDCPLPSPFVTADLAVGLGIHRSMAQRICYCLRETGAAVKRGKRGNALLYEFASVPTKRAG
jgi:hypothetical protein